MTWESIEAVRTRSDLAAVLGGIIDGIGVELGVAAGDYSVELLNAGVAALFSVDRWSDHHDEREMRRARSRLEVFGHRSQIVRGAFGDVVNGAPDGGFDFIYIDGYAHTGQEGGKTLQQWWPKLKPGGVFAGHDYCEVYAPTMAAVDRFVADHHLRLHVTRNDDLPSWVTMKP